MTKYRSLLLIVFLTAFALLAAGVITGCGGSTDSPAGTVEKFFKAVADADEATMRTCLTGKALQTMPKPGSPQFKHMAPMGKAFKGVVDTQVDGDKALVTVKIDAEQVLGAIRDAMLAQIKDPKIKEQMAEKMKASMAKEAKKLEKAQLRLVKKDGKWLISEFVKK